MKIHIGDIDLQKLHLEELPEILNGIKINGHVDLYKNNLKSLKNCPRIISGTFDCSFNNLESLEGCPEVVWGSFHCYGNKVKFTEEYIRSICHVLAGIYT